MYGQNLFSSDACDLDFHVLPAKFVRPQENGRIPALSRDIHAGCVAMVLFNENTNDKGSSLFSSLSATRVTKKNIAHILDI
ncbi:hypothetical protein PsorP6_001764 [Peronosclerospora sorghi]|uniref:Uncharacterized protein n=1 Tax=Peronosclerospora sorghi TaxID=230839 RepID=A0ACC0WTW4_9STRA|nr:hypothetical protein PsorP6_001764 [Peronosclerospora sorghi]